MSEFLETILKAHGDLENWRKVERLEARVSLTGGLYQLKGFPEGVPNVTMSVDTRRRAHHHIPTGVEAGAYLDPRRRRPRRPLIRHH